MLRNEELMPIMENLVRKFTRGESSSITYEVGGQLMEAIRYTINQLGDVSWRDGALLISDGISTKEAYELGHKLLLEKTTKALEIYNSIMENFDDYGNIAYCDTIVNGMPEFFRWYDTEFNPQNTILMLDYPLEEPINGKCGIDMIYAYLVEIEAEQRFLSAFPPGFVRESLHEYHFLGDELVINVSYVLKSLAK